MTNESVELADLLNTWNTAAAQLEEMVPEPG
jgi:hypothetical protein